MTKNTTVKIDAKALWKRMMNPKIYDAEEAFELLRENFGAVVMDTSNDQQYTFRGGKLHMWVYRKWVSVDMKLPAGKYVRIY